jgi:hypothetical protein
MDFEKVTKFHETKAKNIKKKIPVSFMIIHIRQVNRDGKL